MSVGQGNPPRGRNSALMRKVNSARGGGGGQRPPMPARAAPSKSNTGLIVGIVAVVGVVGVVALFALNKKDPPPKKKEKPKEIVMEAPTEGVGPPKTASGFELNARYMIGKEAPRYDIDAELNATFGPAALSGNFEKLITPEHALDYMKLAFTHMIGEDENLALASFRYIQAFFKDARIAAKKIPAPPDMGANFKFANWRAKFYQEWAEWPTKPNNIAVTKDLLDPAAAKAREDEEKGKVDLDSGAQIEDVSDETWERWMEEIRRVARAGELGEQRMKVVSMILKWGRPGLEKLIAQIADEDLGLSKGSVHALNDIVAALPPERGGGTKFQSEIPNANNREAIQAQWKEWYTRDYKDP